MTVDLFDELLNSEVFCFFHNCMWQSRHSEVNVYFLGLCEQTDGLFTFNGSLRSNMICVYVFVCVFVLIYTCNSHCHTTVNKSPCSYNWIFGLWLGLLGFFTTEPNSLIQLSLNESSEEVEVTHILSHIWFLQSPSWYGLRDTIIWKRVVKDDCVRSWFDRT